MNDLLKQIKKFEQQRILEYIRTPLEKHFEYHQIEPISVPIRYGLGEEFTGWLHASSDTSFPQVELINFNEDKKVTTVKFKDGEVVQAKCSPDEQFDEFTGLMVCMFKYHTGMTNQQMQKWLKRMKRREVK